MVRNLPAGWDLEADVVSLGSGGGGLCAAITAHDCGASALVLERSDQVGGVTAYSMGEVWIPGNHHAAALGVKDSPASGYRYIKQLSMDYGDDAAILNQALHAPVALKYFEERIGLKMCVIRDCPDYYFPRSSDSLPEGRYLEVLPFAAESLGEWQSRTRVSPHVPYGMTHADIFHNGGIANMVNWDYSVMSERLANDERCLGAGLAGYFVKGVLDRGISMHTGVNVEELIGDGERIVGVRAIRGGKDFFVKANRGVVIAVSSYERNAGYAKTLGQQLQVESMVMPSVDGAHLRLAGMVGARIGRVPDITLLGFHVPGEEQEDEIPLWRGALPFLGLPHTVVVNRAGKRFANEGFYRAIFSALDIIDGGTQTHPNFPCWAIFDSQARAKYPFGSVMPGQELPKGLGVKADSLMDLARTIGIDAQGLAATIATFNGYCERGEDPEFHRGTHPWGALMCGDPSQKPNANMGPLLKGPFYAVELHRLAGGGIASTGVLADHHCRVIGWDDELIEGLYVAGNSMARMDNGAIMQSGVTNARGMTHGYLAGRHAAGKPSDLLQKTVDSMGLRGNRVIETQQTILIDAAIDRAWDYVQDIRRWANLFPGCKECTVIDTHDSRWTLKVGAGGLVRTVTALVHVDQWDGPECVNFSYRLEGDPVEGSGSYVASSKGAQKTEVMLSVRVAGSGPMAPLWEVISRPLLPKLAKSFASQLKAEIENAVGVSASQHVVVQDTCSR